jgi:hypothetical protein
MNRVKAHQGHQATHSLSVHVLSLAHQPQFHPMAAEERCLGVRADLPCSRVRRMLAFSHSGASARDVDDRIASMVLIRS